MYTTVKRTVANKMLTLDDLVWFFFAVFYIMRISLSHCVHRMNGWGGCWIDRGSREPQPSRNVAEVRPITKLRWKNVNRAVVSDCITQILSDSMFVRHCLTKWNIVHCHNRWDVIWICVYGSTDFLQSADMLYVCADQIYILQTFLGRRVFF